MREAEVLAAMLPHLRDASDEVTARFVLGPCDLGLTRAAYYVGWVLVGRLLARGWTFGRLARTPAGDLTAVVRTLLEERLAELTARP